MTRTRTTKTEQRPRTEPRCPLPGFTMYNFGVEVKRKLRRVGNSVMVPIPPEALAESGLHVGQEVIMRARFGQIDLVPCDGPTADVTAFAARFVDQYRDALRRLAE